MLYPCTERNQPSVTGEAEGDLDLLRGQYHRHFQMLCAGQVPVERHSLPGGFWGFVLCMVRRK